MAYRFPTTATSVRAYGAKGDGSTDDTDAIEAAWSASSGNIYFPPGNYVYNGTGMSSGTVRIVGSGKQTTTITLGSSSYLVNHATFLGRLTMSDLTISGGLGVVKHTYTSPNVSEHHVIERCRFNNYTECAVASDASDMPYWTFRYCMFNAANTTSTIGIALGGLTDSCTISACSFYNNRIHVKARSGASNMWITNSDFILGSSDTSGGPRASIWVVPKAGSSVSAGNGFLVDGCKLTTENMVSGDYKILYADEGSGTTNGVKMPVLDADSTGYVTGHIITGNHFAGVGTTGTYSLIYSTTPNVWSCTVANNTIAAGPPKYLLEFRTVPGADQYGTTNNFGPNGFYGNPAGYVVGISNAAGAGYVYDNAGTFASPESVRQAASGPAAYRSLLSTTIGSFTSQSGSWTKNSDITDALGGTEAATFTATTTSAQLFATLGTMTPGLPVWVEFDLKNPNDGNALDKLRVYTQGPSSVNHWRRSVPVPSVAQGWVSYAFSFVPRNSDASYIMFGNSDSAALKSVAIGRVRVYHGNERQVGGTRPTVTGERLSGAATQSLLTALASQGLIVDSSTAGTSIAPTTIELGHASDTTITRSAAGKVSVEGVDLVDLSSTQTLTNKILTSPKLSFIVDPTNNTVAGWFFGNASAVNYLKFVSSTSGNAAQIAAQSAGNTDANVSILLAPLGSGALQIWAASGNTPTLAATGPDTNLNLKLSPKGTGAVQIPSGNGGFELYNTADQTTNFEKLKIAWASDIIQILSSKGGTGTLRSLQLGARSDFVMYGTAQQASLGTIRFTESNGTAGSAQVGINGTLSAASGMQYGLSLSPTYNQSSTAGYTALLVNSTETATGSGGKLLADFQVGNTSKAKIDNTGIITGLAHVSTKTSTATAAGTTTLTIASSQVQEFTGTTTQTVALPTTSVIAGQSYTIINNSTGAVTVQSSGGNFIMEISSGMQRTFTAQVDTPTTAANWTGQSIVRRTFEKLATSKTYGSTGDYTIFIDASGAPTLPSAVNNTGRYLLKNIDTASKSIATTSSQTIEGITPYVLPAGAAIEVCSDGANWRII